MVSSLLDPAVTDLYSQISQLGRKIAQLERNQRSNYNVQNTAIQGGALSFVSQDGSTQLVVGQQSDGTLTSKVIGQVVPPKAPSTPVAGSGINGIWISWDGLMADGTVPLADFSAVQVHMSTTSGFTPSTATLQGHMLGAGLFGLGPLTPGTTYFVVLQALNEAGNLGPASAQASAVPLSVPSGIPAGSLSGLSIQTGTITTAQIAAAAGILGSQIAQGTITSANILAGSITTALLAANLIIAGAVDGTIITGSTLRNSPTDPKTSINPDGSITITNAASTVIFSIGNDGTVNWYSSSGQLLMQLQPGGTQLIYASLTGPSGWDFEPGSAPNVFAQLTSATSSTTYTVPVAQAVPAGQAIQIFATSSGSTAVTGVIDSKGNTYTLSQSVTTGQELQVWRCDSIIDGLTTSDTLTVTYAAANTQTKTIIGVSEPGMQPTGLLDFAGTGSGTSTTPAATASTAATQTSDLILFAVATPTAPTAVADGYQQLISLNTSGGTWLTIYYSTTIDGSTYGASATITSGAWGAVIMGLISVPNTPVAGNSWTGSNATVSVTDLWTGDGGFSLKVKSSAAVAGWGALSPKFTVQGGASVSMQAQVEAPAALAGVSCGFNWYDATSTLISSTAGDLGTVPCTAGSITEFTVTGATAPPAAAFAQFYVTDTDAVASLVMNIDVVQVPGGLVFSNSPTGGTDNFGNAYGVGINFIGLPGLTNVFGVQDPYGATLASIDSSGNVTGQTLSAAQDILLAGNSLLNNLFPSTSGGGEVIGFPSAYTSSQYPGTSVGTTETALFYISAPVVPGRAYLVQSSNMRIQTSVANAAVRMRVRGTTNGATPTTSSDVFTGWFGNSDSVGSVAAPVLSKVFVCPAGVTTLNLAVTLQAATSGQTCFLNQFSSSTFVTTDNQLFVIDLSTGAVVNSWSPLAGGSGGTTTTSQFYAAKSWSFYGGGTQRNINGTMYQGLQSPTNGYGAQYAYMDFTAVASTITGGSTINSATLRLKNVNSYYSAGCTVGLYAASTVNNRATMSASPVAQWTINEGQLLTHTLPNSVVSTWLLGGQPYLALGPNPWQGSSLQYGGEFYGAVGGSQAYQPLLTVNWTA
jgi:hypothetical protein